MTWPEFREYLALCVVSAIGSAAAALMLWVAIVATGAALGGFFGAISWGFCAVSGLCK